MGKAPKRARTNEGGRRNHGGPLFLFLNEDVLQRHGAMRNVFFYLKEESKMKMRMMLKVIVATGVVFQAVGGLAFAINPVAPMPQMAPAACMPPMELPTGHDNLVDVNSAPKDWLVWAGIDESLAEKIISERPYRTRTDLLTKGILPPELYEKIKARIIARQV
jgi:hypothetical protein